MVDVNQTFGLGQNAIGVNTGILPTIYTPLTSGVSSIALTGSFSNIGDTVTANINTAGILATNATATYEGYHLDSDGHYTYFFSGAGGGLTSTVDFAVTGTTLPLLSASNITAGPAPADNAITPCFVTGTLIRTTRGDVAVEDLLVGDEVLTLGGGVQPVTWVGRRKDEAARYAPQHRVDFWPVKFLAGSLGSSRPERDLSVSPCHNMFVDGVRVAAFRLLNGTSIIHDSSVTAVEYFHVELEQHSIIFANGAASESYFEFDQYHRRFDNRAEYNARPSVQARIGKEVADGADLERIREKLAVVAAMIVQAETV